MAPIGWKKPAWNGLRRPVNMPPNRCNSRAGLDMGKLRSLLPQALHDKRNSTENFACTEVAILNAGLQN
jgi:hypothetical protein